MKFKKSTMSHDAKNRSQVSGLSPQPSESGFSLIELMSAIAILMIIMVSMSVIFIESDRSWTTGTGRAENNAFGRAAISAIAHDLQYAVACSNRVRDKDLVLSFAMRTDQNTLPKWESNPKVYPVSYGFTNSELCFVSYQHDSSLPAPRAGLDVWYFVKPMKDDMNGDGSLDFAGRYELTRNIYLNKEHYLGDDNNHSYENADWYDKNDDAGNDRPTNNNKHQNRGTLVENVVGFRCFAKIRSGGVTNEYYSIDHNNELPEYVDIMLDLLNKDDALKVAGFPVATADEIEYRNSFVEKKMRRYTTRVYFKNENFGK